MAEEIVTIDRQNYDSLVIGKFVANEDNVRLRKMIQKVKDILEDERQRRIKSSDKYYFLSSIDAERIYSAVAEAGDMSFGEWNEEGRELREKLREESAKENDQPDPGYQE